MFRHTTGLLRNTWYRVDTASGSSTPTTVTEPDGVTTVRNVYGGSGSTVKNTTPEDQAVFTSATQVLYLKPLDWVGNVDGAGTVVTSTGVDLTQPTTPDLTSIINGLPTTYAGVVAIAAPTGTSDDTALFTAAEARLPTNGGIVWLGLGVFKLPTGYAFTKRVTLLGQGAGRYEDSPTRIEVSSATANGVTFGGQGSQVRDLAIVNTSGAATAGAGLYFTAGNWSRIDRVLVNAFWNNIQYDQGYYFSVADSAVLNPKNYGMYFRNTASGEFDHGDQVVEGCVIAKYGDTAAGGTAVRWESGGGLRFVNNKINGGTQPGYTSTGKFANGIAAFVTDGGSTSVLVVTGNSIENCTAQAIRADQAGPSNTGGFSKVVVTGNEIAINGYGVWLGAQAAGFMSTAVIDGNAFTDSATGIWVASNFQHVAIGANVFSSVTSCIQTSGNNVSIAKQTYVGDNLLVVQDFNVGNTVRGPFSLAKQTFDREIPATTSSSTYSSLWRMTVPQNSAGFIEVNLGGWIAGVGNFALKTAVSYSRATGAVTATGLEYLFDTATTSGDLYVKIRLKSGGGGTDVLGRASMTIDGPMYIIKKGS
jgi:hypothetical protein